MEMKFILQEIRNGKKDYREIYLNNILEQYKSATGCKQIDFNSAMFRKELNEWLNQRKKIGESYRSLLDYMEIEFAHPKTAELSKGLADSIVSNNSSTTIITPYTYGLDKKTGNKIIKGIIKYGNFNPKQKSLDENEKTYFIDNFMTQNPYKKQELNIFEAMHNSDKYSIIVGIYGTNYDKDREEKIKLLRSFKEHLSLNYDEEYIKYNDNYCYVIATRSKIKRKSKTL